MQIHLSVQANAINWATVKFWKDYGLSRVILSRELSLEEIEEIQQHVPDIELEVFCTWCSMRGLLRPLLTFWIYE